MATTHNHNSRNNRSKTYRIWSGLIQRCTNPKNDAYYRYGGRGITICEQWRTFEGFLADIKRLTGFEIIPSHLTLDRIDNNGNYEPGNIRLLTIKEQQYNKRTNVVIEWNGKTQTLKEWSDELGIHYVTLRTRLKRGMSVEKAFTMTKFGNKSGVVGVCWNKNHNRWQGHIKVNGKTINLGSFKDKEEAIAARKAAEMFYNSPA